MCEEVYYWSMSFRINAYGMKKRVKASLDQKDAAAEDKGLKDQDEVKSADSVAMWTEPHTTY